MGSACCTLCKLVGHLKQPYQCMVNCGCYSLQTSLVFIAIGVTLVYFFIQEIEDENKFRRGLAIAGIVGIAVGVVLLVVGVTIMAFYSRLYKLHKRNLEQLVEPSYKEKCKKYMINGSQNFTPDARDKSSTLHSNISGTALDAQQNMYPYNPNVAIAIPSAPPSETPEDIPAVHSTWTADQHTEHERDQTK